MLHVFLTLVARHAQRNGRDLGIFGRYVIHTYVVGSYGFRGKGEILALVAAVIIPLDLAVER